MEKFNPSRLPQPTTKGPSQRVSKRVIPRLDQAATESGSGGRKVERFSHYVERHLGFLDPSKCRQLCRGLIDRIRSTFCPKNRRGRTSSLFPLVIYSKIRLLCFAFN
ncbi:unnamed protein product [Linum tenue]|uniref:Uncharacterized protein n=1 Tax=Linum tenue TaxID=586396 RepID=A0AAV0L2U3_9ROSI|nr:unnamed protein product [Linum tenue]